MRDVSLAERRELCAEQVLLNGQPARISGYVKGQFATITDVRTRLSCEFAWETAARIVARGGEFQS